jgi:hypothetical protein
VSGFGHCITTQPAPASLSATSAARPFDLFAPQDQAHPVNEAARPIRSHGAAVDAAAAAER